MNLPGISGAKGGRAVGPVLVGLVAGIWASPASATVPCLIADPNDTTLNVRDGPRGKVINRLKNGRTVFHLGIEFDARGKPWAKVGGMYKGRWRNWGWVFEASLKCSTSEAYEASGSRVEKVNVHDLAAQGIGWAQNLGVQCPYQGEGQTISLSPDLAAHYKQRGFSLTAMCLGLASERVNFDPSTGASIPQYEIVGETGAFGRFPFFLPDCYRKVRVLAGRNSGWVRWRPDGCDLRYDPITGARLQHSGDVLVTTGGEAGDANQEASGESSVTNARLRALLRRK